MGSHYYKHCRADRRFTSTQNDPHFDYGSVWLVHDWDQRRTISALQKCIDSLPTDTVLLSISDDGAVLSSSSDALDDASSIPFYPSRTDFPPNLATVRRHDLTEVDRLGLQVDLTTYQPCRGKTRLVVFKYYIIKTNVAIFWHEANCVLRIPRHPNIVPFDALVVDAVEGNDKVVGFTTRYVPGGTFSENKDRIFKLKYLKQLINAVDYLNLRLGIVHGDICPWNLLIDAETDSIQIFDFNCAAKLGWEGDRANRCEFAYEEDCNDVKFVVFTLYEIITREFEFRREFYPHELKIPVAEYRHILTEWVSKRKKIDKEINHFTKTPEPLDWPPLPDSLALDLDSRPIRRPAAFRVTLMRLGKDFLKWQRPPTRDTPPPKGWRLLATGEVVRDNEEGSSIAAET
ncbi:hypothetical protein QBC33DRAFT_614276 [Phialemonium atrogriseum]|uniref:EKC/KEOPS complex subunit BUD32 n=1 Tax=Phialemonium atrogriseum TaxID=1093897 RepID=A0AAJ0BQD6_9PEZI|nr:uncharacterized protein QBC33DRAFT_614276 [Phialemonium atrogriseum]KAK1762548.1 hypothetical protein QBC33DRAFT_614276 [Phialemonium atrogriseum]